MEVTTRDGRLRGVSGKGFEVFRGIPFAKPPLGPLRFRAPQPVEAWTGVRDAGSFGPASFQAQSPMAALLVHGITEESEDCLYLNVWSPAVDGEPRAVMVWLHGGAFVIGAGSQTMFDGAALAVRENVVVVTVNYRLGIFGFLHGRSVCGDELDSTGNEGVLDQVAALEWVKENIDAFGGDPGNVTVFGESAGAISISMLLAMPTAKGLFHKAILQSGAPNVRSSLDTAGNVTERVLHELGVKPEHAGKLRELSAEQLMEAQNKATPRSSGVAYRPVLDGAIIPEEPFAAIARGSAQGIPLLVGTTRDEMRIYGWMDPNITSMDEAGLRSRCEAAIMGGQDGVSNGERAIDVYRRAREAGDESTAVQDLWFAISTDQTFRAPAMMVAESQARHTPDVFAYLFTYESPAAHGALRACHALDVPFVFGTFGHEEIRGFAGDGPEAARLSTQMMAAWGEFARSGKPSHRGLPEWPRYEPHRRATMELGVGSQVLSRPMEAERAFWETVR